jgi:hypothetical protein
MGKIGDLVLNIKRRLRMLAIPLFLSFIAGLTVGLLAFYFNKNAALSVVITFICTVIAYVLCESLTIVTEEGWM